MIPDDVLTEIAAHAKRESPKEACGFISRSISDNGDSWRIHPVPNASKNPEREFVMEPQAQIDAMRTIRSSGAELFGTYHSHPKTPPVPSEKDRHLALYPDLIHVIVSLAGREPEFGVWRISAHGYEESGLREASGMR